MRRSPGARTVSMEGPQFGAIEAGGTKFVCAVGSSPDDLSEAVRIPTTDPDVTLDKVIAYFRSMPAVDALGIASFGPADVDEASPHWGTILSTPKPGWSNCDLAGRLSRALGVPVGFDTDVNGAAMAEHRWGAAKGAGSMAYVTVGTGIGGGFITDGRLLRGLRHPEIGHIMPRRHPADTAFAGTCPFHDDCLEGLASGPAIAARWGAALSQLPTAAHDIVAWYLAQLVVAIEAFVSPELVIFGGGVMHASGLLERVARAAQELAAGYFGDHAGFEDILYSPGLGELSGLAGGLCLAERAWRRNHDNRGGDCAG